MSVAKGLAYSLRLPLVGIGTLEIEAYQHAASGLPVCTIYDAGRGEIAVAVFSGEGGMWRQITEERLTTLEALCQCVRSRTVFCGEIAKYGDSLKEKLKEFAIFPPIPSRLRRAGYLAALGWLKLKQGIHDKPDTLQPLYLRKPPITQPKIKYSLAEEKSDAPGP
jgi:tRNA threonylcarbamoyladenosine biosynthesis protein TsaB